MLMTIKYGVKYGVPALAGAARTMTHAPSMFSVHRGMAPAKAGTPCRIDAAFTLLEVMIACGIFFIAVFAILGLVSNTLRNAQALRHVPVDAGLVAAQFLGKTNRMTLGTDSGDFGKLYPDCSWETDTEEAGTNGLVQVDIIVRRRGQAEPVDKLSILVYDPNLPKNPFGPRPKP